MRGPSDQVVAIFRQRASWPGAGTRSVTFPSPGGAELLESRELVRRFDSQPAKSRLLFRGEVRDEGEIVLLRAPLQAELIVHAAVALDVEMERQRVERRPGRAPGERLRPRHQVT